MDYSKFYHDWLQLDLVQGEAPNFYQILGLNNMEPDVQKIEDAFRNTLDRLQGVNGMTNPEAYTVIMSRVLEAHRVFNDPNQKHDYDLQLSRNTGERVWKGYERPSLLTRVRQMSLIAFSFILGLGVMVVMALTVDRNPDGSIIFREESQARKAPPFSTQLDYVVYRPSIAQDYQPNGYTVAVNKPAVKTEPLQTPISSEIAESKPEAQAQETQPSDMSASLENQSAQSEMEEFSQILSGEIAPPPKKETAKVGRRSPLYKMAAALNQNTSSDETASADPDESLEDATEIAEVPGITELAGNDSPKQEMVLSLTTMTELLEKVRSNLDLTKPDASEAYALLQYQTISEVLQKLCEAEGALDQEEAQNFTEYTLKVVTDLGWEKRFNEAYELCEMLKTLSAKKEMTDLLDDSIDQRRKVVQNYQALYQDSLKTLEQLQKNPDDPKLNTQYAMWLWQEKGVEESIPYLAKCQYEQLRNVAVSEMSLAQNESLNTPKATLMIADYWWYIAEHLPEKYVPIVKEHAKKLYRKVDSNQLSENQKARVANL